MGVLDTFDSRQLRNVLGTFTTGVTVVTTRDGQGLAHGVTANSFSSVSLDPPLVLWSQALTSKSFAAFRESDHFTVNVLADDQIALSNHFAKSHEDKFAAVHHTVGLGGAPLLPGTSAHLECVKVAAYPAGDHVIYVGRVERIGYSGRRPLAFTQGRYMVPYAHELGPLAMQVGNAVFAEEGLLQKATDSLPAIREALGGHSICLAGWGNHGTTVLRWSTGKSQVELPAGLVMSTTRTAVGRTFAAFLPTTVTRPFVEEELRLFRKANEDEVESREQLERDLAVVRLRGMVWMTDPISSALHGSQVLELSVPLFNSVGNIVLALGMITDESVERENAERILVQMAEPLSAASAQPKKFNSGMSIMQSSIDR